MSMLRLQVDGLREQISKATIDALDKLAKWLRGDAISESNYEKLFGTPEKAARTLGLLHVEWSDWCAVFSECRDCMFGQVDGERVTCWEPDDFSLVEWLRGDAE